MAVYKVIQDIEAEDKLLGPLSLKSFVYAGIAGVLAFLSFRLLISGIGPIKYLFIIIFLPPMALFGVLASPLGRDQPTEVWLLSRVRFMLKPRKRIWNQSGISHPVTVSVPKKAEQHLTKDLTQTEVKSRLKALANTIDSRGWAVKNASLTDQDIPTANAESNSDRLVGLDSTPKEKSPVEVHPKDDILDEKHNPTAQKFDKMMKQAEGERRKGLVEMLKSALIDPKKEHHDVKPESNESAKPKSPQSHHHKTHKGKHPKKAEAHTEKTHQESYPPIPKNETPNSVSKPPEGAVTPAVTKAEPPKAQPVQSKDPTGVVTPPAQAVNMKLAQSGSDLKVSTVAQMADHLAKVRQIGPNEVEIDLH